MNLKFIEMLKILQKKKNYKKKIQTFSFLLLLIGFIFGNLFGLNFHFIKWNIFSIFVVSFLLEIGNFFQNRSKNCKLYSKFLIFNYFKRGFLLGIFIEAFKVGS